MPEFNEDTAKKLVEDALGAGGFTEKEKLDFAHQLVSRSRSPEATKTRLLLAAAISGVPMMDVLLAVSETLLVYYTTHTSCRSEIPAEQRAADIVHQLAKDSVCPFEIIGVACGMLMAIAFAGLAAGGSSPMED